MKKIMSVFFSFVFLLLLVSCDSLSSSGENDVLLYTLDTHYDPGTSSLKNATLVAGVDLTILVSIYNYKQGIKYPQITHIAEPSEGVVITTLATGCDNDALCVGNFTINVPATGSYTIKSMYNNTVVDYITLHFEVPASLETIVKTRNPYQDSFEEKSGTSFSVQQGTQVVFIPIALGSAGARLAGDLPCTFTPDNGWMVVPGQNLISVGETWDVTNNDPASFYFINPGNVTFTIQPKQLTTTQDISFSVSEYPH